MEKEKKKGAEPKQLNIKDVTTCEATTQMLRKAEKDGVEEIAVPRLPQQLVNQSAKPLTLGFKYLKHPYRLELDVKKHDKISVPVATINSAHVVTMFTEDGKVVHRLVYQVRNSAKQFLEIQLPDQADVWSVFVNKGPVESSVSTDGKKNRLVSLLKKGV